MTSLLNYSYHNGLCDIPSMKHTTQNARYHIMHTNMQLGNLFLKVEVIEYLRAMTLQHDTAMRHAMLLNYSQLWYLLL